MVSWYSDWAFTAGPKKEKMLIRTIEILRTLYFAVLGNTDIFPSGVSPDACVLIWVHQCATVEFINFRVIYFISI